MAAAKTRTAPDTPDLAPPPTGDWWDETQWSVLLSLLDAVLAPVVANGDARVEQQKANKAAAADTLRFNRATFKQLPKAELNDAIARARNAFTNPPAANEVSDYLADRASDNPKFLMGVRRTLSGVSVKDRGDLGGLLTMLSYVSQVTLHLFSAFFKVSITPNAHVHTNKTLSPSSAAVLVLLL